ncbi:cobyrinate a,c-diamide synthase [Aureimonas leprariae]|uniref:Hydrogenobyrinate a,c-diamide synthase n=1 Tax=Plantimonas leprariae TaxID=2615207 RepID=A0A7V7PP28_9HYPH|nr:cobyrinate a,c-diamide synthase [Aureimonas leprariae]KAB0679639.1 cobyrinate a,c-diamide synthase [Aureimonas leprariae]
MPGLLIAAPQSGAGKTTVTLGLLRALRRAGHRVASAKAGPDYIDPAYHHAAGGRECRNLDPWAMRPDLLRALAADAVRDAQLLVVEGMMGLFDGAADGTGSAADLAELLELRIVLVVDCARQSHSVAALVRGFRDHRLGLALAGLVLNRVGSPRHEALLRDALLSLDIPVLGALPARPDLALSSRHLGLVQAGEHPDLEGLIERAADWIEAGTDLDAFAGLASATFPAVTAPRLEPLGNRIAVARDAAFAFAYPHMLEGWRAAGAALAFFSPLADEAPDPEADAVFLPGGYPELHAGPLAAAARFKAGMLDLSARGAAIYGECGGYMVLGEGLEDAAGETHAMLGLLPLATSFRQRKRHLGYRRLVPLVGAPWATALTAHEFHYATILHEGSADRLFAASDALGTDLGSVGLRRGRVCGSFAHVIDRLA